MKRFGRIGTAAESNRIEDPVSGELKSSAVKLLAAGLGDQTDGSTAGPAVLGGHGVGLNVEFLDRIHDRSVSRVVIADVVFRKDIGLAVDLLFTDRVASTAYMRNCTSANICDCRRKKG